MEIFQTGIFVSISMWTFLILITLTIALFFFRLKIDKWISSKRISKENAHKIALWLNYIGGLLLIFSAIPSTSKIGSFSILVSFLPTFLGLIPIMLAFEIERSLSK